jgi:hypothetical protein
MKRFLFSLLLLVISVFVHAQNNNQCDNSIITSQKIVVKNDEYPNGRPAIYLIPIVSKKYPELRKALSDTILFEGEKLDTVIKELKTSIDNLKSSVLFKNYLFSKEGLMISMEKILPHVTQNCEPYRELLIPFSKLRPFKVSTASVIK